MWTGLNLQRIAAKQLPAYEGRPWASEVVR